ncbi:penicillin-binding protein 2 [bacterium]|nr:penicillin-binding protein 2 [bacterium]MDY3021125.1 penicillin-binding protein 2 [Oliverpabstia sp.]
MSNKKKRKRANPLLTRKINSKMRKKLVCLFGLVVLALVGLCVRITYINASEGNQYKKQVLSQSQQKYESRVIPFKRGDILDRNGTVLSTSEKVYKIILDCKVVNSKEDYVEPTIKAMVEILGLDEDIIREKLENEETKSSQYQIMKTNVSITVKKEFEDYTDISSDEAKEKLSEEERMERQNVKGVWFEEDYRRVYPMGSTACDLIGFTYSGNSADWGIEGYYSSTLNGVNGRQYGYFNSDADVEQTIIEPKNGNSVVSTIDVTIQQIVEKYIQKFMDGMANGPRGEKGAENVGVVVADPNNGEILAMASSDPYDLNNPRNLESFFTEEEIKAMDDETMLNELYGIWKNYCISDAFEPGSTVKPLTIAGALQSGAISSDETYFCDGYQMFGDTRIRCSIFPGEHGTETLSDLLKYSCNDGLMQIAAEMGPEEFLEYQKIFNFGSVTGIDLPGEATGLIHSENQLSSRSTELACASFGQGYTCTMIQEIAAICSVINGGHYYQPHVVSKILDEDSNVVKNIEPVVMKQTVSSDVSALIRSYMGSVVEKGGTGNAAKVDGYSMGGKTGTAQKGNREDKKYIVSFIGFAPLDDPQVVVYVVVDEPNAEYQADSKFAQYIAKGVMTEILPYLNIFPDQEMTGTVNNAMEELENYITQRAQENRQKTEDTKEGTDDPNVPEPDEDEEELTLDNKQDSDGITNEEAGLESGN